MKYKIMLVMFVFSFWSCQMQKDFHAGRDISVGGPSTTIQGELRVPIAISQNSSASSESNSKSIQMKALDPSVIEKLERKARKEGKDLGEYIHEILLEKANK